MHITKRCVSVRPSPGRLWCLVSRLGYFVGCFRLPENCTQLDVTERFKGSVRRAREEIEARRFVINEARGVYIRSARMSKKLGHDAWYKIMYRPALPDSAAEVFTPGLCLDGERVRFSFPLSSVSTCPRSKCFRPLRNFAAFNDEFSCC